MNPQIAFGIEGVVKSMLDLGKEFSGGAALAAGGLFTTILLFHAVEGAAEMADGKPCRWLRSIFYWRLGLVFVLLLAYQPLFFGVAEAVLPKNMHGFTNAWGNVWVNQTTDLENMRKADQENQDLKKTEVTATQATQGDGSWAAKLGLWMVDGMITGLGWVVVTVVGGMLTLFVLMEAFWSVGVSVMILAIGPLCIAAGAHEKTSGLALAFIRSWFVYVLLYMRLLGLACECGGVFMARMTSMVSDQGWSYGDGTNVFEHAIIVLTGPFCVMALVRSVQGCMASLMGASASGSGASFAGIMQTMQSAMRFMGRGGGGGGKGGGGGGGGDDDRSDDEAKESSAKATAAKSVRGGQ